jgi:hypothetical protein
MKTIIRWVVANDVNFSWNPIDPSEYLIDLVNKRKIVSLHSMSIPTLAAGARVVGVYRQDDGSLHISPNTYAIYEHLATTRVLPDPDFDLDEIHQAQDMLGATGRI